MECEDLKVKGTTRTIAEECLRLLKKQEHLQLFDESGARCFSHELLLEYTMRNLTSLLNCVKFADDDQPMCAQSILANVIHYNTNRIDDGDGGELLREVIETITVNIE